ncbi:MFS transporter [Microbacterium sp.]|uniref:MFS transporter n=1 Tax=Microbacterium sp. TaxID=51671 RepID=UPI003A8DA7A1
MTDTTRDHAAAAVDAPRLSLGARVGFGVGDLAINLTWASLGMFIVFFYTDVVGISAAVVGTLIAVSRIFDGFVDVAVGALVDRTRSRWGKARPWLLFGAIPFAICSTLVFAVPDASDTVKFIYAFVSYNLLMIAFSAIAIPYGTLNTLISGDTHEREVLNIFRMFLAQIGILIVTSATLPMVDAFGGGQGAWVATYAILSALSTLLLWVTFASQREKSFHAGAAVRVPLLRGLASAFRNKYWILAFLFFLVFSIGYALNQGALVYYAKWILGDENLVSPLTWAFIIPIMVGFLFLAPLLRRFGKRNVVIVSSILSIIGLAITFIAPDSVTIVALSQVVKGLGQVGMLGVVWAFFPDTIEYGEWRTGTRAEGILYAGGSFAQKVGIGLGTALMGIILSLGGYDGTLAAQSSSADASIFVAFIVVPAAGFVVQILLLLGYRLDRQLPGIIRELAERRSA